MVAQDFSISPSTVRTHVESALPEAGVLGASYGDAEGYAARSASAQRSGQAQAWRSLMYAPSVAEIEQVWPTAAPTVHCASQSRLGTLARLGKGRRHHSGTDMRAHRLQQLEPPPVPSSLDGAWPS
jgi:hypothetical protein